MTQIDFALGAAVHFDFELATHPEPFENLVRDLVGVSSASGEFRHWYIPLEGKRTPPPPAFDLSRLVRLVRRGVASAAAETLPNAADPDRLLVVAGTRPLDAAPERFTMTKCRYDAVIVVGCSRLRQLGTQRVIDAIVTFADAVAARAGVVHCATTSAYAAGLASCGGSTVLSTREVGHITDLMYFQPQWGDVIRGPAWGTFLGPSHVDRLGGAGKLAETAPCARVVSLPSGGGYLQVTATDQPILERDSMAPLDELALFLDQVVGHRGG
ncbi:MAG: type VI immunity family protein [Kofleriaceae bacterium]